MSASFNLLKRITCVLIQVYIDLAFIMIPNTRPQRAAGPSYSVNKPTHPVQTNKWTVNSKQADLTEMLQSSLTNMNLTNPPPTRPTHPPPTHANGPPVNTQYQHQPPKQGVYLPLPAWLQGKGSVPPLYQEVTTQCADPRQSYYLLTNKIQPLLLSSGLDKVQLKAIWDICNRTAPGVLTLTECYTVLGLIALVQQGHEIELDKLMSLSFVPIPRIDTSVLYQQPTNQIPNSYTQQPVATNIPKQPQSYGEFKSANTDTTFGNFQSAGSEFGTFQSAVTPIPINNVKEKTQESLQLHRNSPIPINDTNLSTTDNSDKYSCFRDVDNVTTFSPVETADSVSDDKYAFLRALGSGQTDTLPNISINSTVLQATQSADIQAFPSLKSADTSATITNNTIQDFSVFNTTSSLQPQTSLLPTTQTPVATKGHVETTLIPDRNVVKSDFSEFSSFQSADTNCSIPSKEPISTETDWSAFTSTTLQNNNNTTAPENDKYSIFSQLKSADQNDAVPLTDSSKLQTTTTETDCNTIKPTALQNDNNATTSGNDKYSIFSQLQSTDQLLNEQSILSTNTSEIQTTQRDWSAFTSSTLQSDNNTTAPGNDKYSIFSQLQSADQLINEQSILSTNTSEIQTTQRDWSAFTSSTLQSDNNTTAPGNDKYSIFSQNQSADQDPSPIPPLPTPSDSSTIEELSNKEAVVPEQKITGSDEMLSNPNKLHEFTDFSVFQSTVPLLSTSNPSQPIPVNNDSNIVNLNTTTNFPPEIVATAPVSKSEKQVTKTSAVSTSDSINRNTAEESNFNEPPPLDDVPNDDIKDDDYNFSGFNSFLTNDSYQTPEPKSNQQGKQTDTNPQSITSVLQSAALEEFNDVNNEDTDVQDTPLATTSSHFPDTTHTPPPTHYVTEPDMIEERTPLADKTLTSQDVGVSEQGIDFSVFSQFRTLPKTEELDCNYPDSSSQSKGENDFILSSNNKLSQNQDFSEFSSFQKASDSSVLGETLEESEHNLNPVPDPFQDLSLLQTSDLMKGQPSNLQQPKWTLFDTLATALQDLNSVPIDNYKNQKFQTKKEPFSEIQQEESFSKRRSSLPPERELDFGEFTDATKTNQVMTRAPSYKLSEDSSKEIKETWSHTLSASARVIHFCLEKVKSATSVQILKELCTHETSHQYFLAVFEVIKIVSRIKKLLPANWEDSNSLYNDITADWANIKAYLNHGELEFCDIVVSTESESGESPCHCGVCLDVVLKGDIKIELGGFNYHNTCANFWLNEVGSILPRLSMESHGLSI